VIVAIPLKELVKNLVEAYGPSGREEVVRAMIEGLIREKVDETHTDALGNLIAVKKGTGGGKRVMVAAHMDEIGVMVTYVDKKGFLRFARVGGVFYLTTVGARVRFANGTVGVMSWEKWLQSQDRPPMDELFIDVGAVSAQDASVGVGDAAVFDRPFADLGQRLVSKAMDDRIGCAVAIQALMEITTSPNDIYFVFTTQEEVGPRGAVTSAFGVDPEIGLAVDVTTTGDTPEARPMAVELGKGPAIKVMDSGTLAHPGVRAWMTRTAEEQGIPYQLEVLEFGGTDAEAIQRSRAGVPAGCLSIPCRYVHSPSEMVDYQDVENAVKLLVALLSNSISL
jgi:putative aminopeptidase FrvX